MLNRELTWVRSTGTFGLTRVFAEDVNQYRDILTEAQKQMTLANLSKENTGFENTKTYTDYTNSRFFITFDKLEEIYVLYDDLDKEWDHPLKRDKILSEIKLMNPNANDFAIEACRFSNREFPNLNEYFRLNCWEMVLMAALKSGATTRNKLRDLYKGSDDFFQKFNYRFEIEVKDYKNYNSGGILDYGNPLSCGDIVIFGVNDPKYFVSHFVIATGNLSADNTAEIITFWPDPEMGKDTSPKQKTIVYKTSIKNINDITGPYPYIWYVKPKWK